MTFWKFQSVLDCSKSELKRPKTTPLVSEYFNVFVAVVVETKTKRINIEFILKSKESLEELQQYAIDMFSDVPNKSFPEQPFDSLAYTNDSLSTRKYITPVQDIRNMSISWTKTYYREHTDANPVQYTDRWGAWLYFF